MNATGRARAVGAILRLLPVCIAPPILVGRWWSLLAAKGPYWLGTNSDPDYPYLLNALGLLRGVGPGHVDHPGTPVQLLLALIARATHLASGGGAVHEDVLLRPEHYLLVANGVLLLAFAASLVLAGLAALRTTGSLAAAIAVQLLAGLSPVICHNVICVKPEPLLATLVTLLAALVLRTLQPGRPRAPNREATLFGVLAGLLVATKVTAAPVVVLPLLLVRSWGGRARFAGVAALTFAASVAPAWGRRAEFVELMHRISTHSGRYGFGRATVFDRAEYASALGGLVANVSGALPVVVGAIGAAVASALALRARRTADERAASVARALAATVAAQLACYLVVARHPANHYLLPALALTGVVAALAIHGAGALVGAGRWRARGVEAVAAGLLVLASQRLGAATAELDAWLRQQRDDQLAVVASLARTPHREVVHYYTSSSVEYALHFGDFYARWGSDPWLRKMYPDHRVYNIWAARLEVPVLRDPKQKTGSADLEPLTPEILCGPDGASPALFQGTPVEVHLPDLPQNRALVARLEPVHVTPVEALYRVRGCDPGGAEATPATAGR
jgi:hypothetical protein